MAIEKLMGAEARGLLEKAEAMKKLDGVGREHEEFRLQLATQKEIALGTLDARVNMAEKQAAILVKAFENANINIVGGDGQFFERFISAVSVGQSIDGAIGNSKALQHALGDYLEGDGNIVRDLKGVLGTGASGTIKDLTLSALIGRLMTGADDDKRQKLQALIDEAQRLGVDQLSK